MELVQGKQFCANIEPENPEVFADTVKECYEKKTYLQMVKVADMLLGREVV